MDRSISALLGLGLLLSLSPAAQAVGGGLPEGQPVVVPNASRHVVHASQTGHAYRIHVARPYGEAPPGGYPVIYLLDANAMFLSMAEAVRLQTRPPYGFDPAIVVGIGYETEEAFATKERYRDYTPPADPALLPKRPGGPAWDEIGGFAAFLAFIEDELKPMIEAELPIDRTRQTIFGHSLGGLFVLQTLFTRPEAFQRYAAGSPSLWWNGREPVRAAQAFAEAVAEAPLDLDVTIIMGSEELDHMLADANEVAAILAPLAPHGVRATYRVIDETEHVSVMAPAIGRVVGFALAPPELSAGQPPGR